MLSASAGAALATSNRGFVLTPQKQNPQIDNNEQFAAATNPIQSVPTETLGTMAYNGGGAEAAGTMASAGSSVSSVSCVA